MYVFYDVRVIILLANANNWLKCMFIPFFVLISIHLCDKYYDGNASWSDIVFLKITILNITLYYS